MKLKDAPDTPAVSMPMRQHRPKVPREAGEIAKKYNEQLAALRASAKGFDAGNVWEAERISVVVQTLCHSAGQTTSLLDQMDLKSRNYLDSADEFRPTNKVAHCTLVSVVPRIDDAVWIAELDGRPMRFVGFDEWWTTPVLTDGAHSGRTMSRRDLTQIMRNQDGGGHIDPLIDAAYREMARAIDFRTDKGSLLTKDGERFAMRQIGHELLKSLIPTYRKRPASRERPYRTLVLEETGSGPPHRECLDYTRTPPEDNCPCGSGRRFRSCHAAGAQSPIAMPLKSAEVTVPPGGRFASFALPAKGVAGGATLLWEIDGVTVPAKS